MDKERRKRKNPKIELRANNENGYFCFLRLGLTTYPSHQLALLALNIFFTIQYCHSTTFPGIFFFNQVEVRTGRGRRTLSSKPTWAI